MARLVTRLQLVTRVRQRADVEGDPHVTDTEIQDLINEAIPRVWDILVAAAPPDYYSTEVTVTCVAGQVTYALATVAADFYKVRRLWQDYGSGKRRQLELVVDGDRERYEGPSGGELVVFRYIPVAPKLANDAATFDGVNGWEELIVLEAALDVLTKQERSTSDLRAKRDREEERIESMAYRDAGAPQTIRRTRGGDRWLQWAQQLVGYNVVGSNLELYRPVTGWPWP